MDAKQDTAELVQNCPVQTPHHFSTSSSVHVGKAPVERRLWEMSALPGHGVAGQLLGWGIKLLLKITAVKPGAGLPTPASLNFLSSLGRRLFPC